MNQITTARDTTTPASEAQIVQALALLSTSLPYRENGNPELRERAYVAALSGVTRYGLNLATQAALKGEHGSGFFPSSAEYRQLYERVMAPVYEQRAREIRQKRERLDSEWVPPTPEQKARVAELLKGFHELLPPMERPEFDWDAVNARFDARRVKG